MEKVNNQAKVLYCMINSKWAYEKILSSGVNQTMFSGVYRKIFNSVCRYRAEHDVNTILVTNLDIKDTRTVSKLFDFEVMTSLWSEYVKGLKKDFVNRKWREITRAKEIKLTDISKIIEELEALRTLEECEDYSLKDIISSAIETIEARQSKDYINEFKLGLPDYDMLGHFERKSLLVIGGESGHGKSSLVLNMVYRWINNGLSVIYFSYEMSAIVIATKLNLLYTALDWNKTFVIRDDRLNDKEFSKLIDGFKWLEGKKVVIIEKMKTVDMMETIIRSYQPDVFVLDTINTMIKEQHRVDIALGDIARRLKRIAVDTNSLAVIIAQLKDIPERPTDKNMIKESRQIRDEADYMDFIYREEEKNIVDCPEKMRGIIEIYRVKGRLTGVGYCYLGFDKSTGRVFPLLEDKVKEIDNYKYECRMKGIKR